MFIFVLLFVLGTPVDVSYSGPKDGQALSDFHPQPWTEGDTAWTARDTHLMSSATAEDATSSGLPLGTKLTVVARSGDLVRHADRVDYWYEVTTTAAVKGFVFGADLTPAVFEADLDDDGRKEMATLSWTPELTLRVRYSDKGMLKELDVEPSRENCGRRGGVAVGALVAKKDAGRTLLRITTRGDDCPAVSDVLISFVGSEPRLAFATPVLETTSASVKRELEFTTNRLKVTETTSYAKKPGWDTTVSSTYVLKKGVYVQQTDPSSRDPNGH